MLLWNGTGVLNDLTHRTVMLYKHVIYLKYAAVWKDSKSLLISQHHLRFYSLWLSIKLRLKQLYDKTRDVANWVFKSFDIKNKKTNKQKKTRCIRRLFLKEWLKLPLSHFKLQSRVSLTKCRSNFHRLPLWIVIKPGSMSNHAFPHSSKHFFPMSLNKWT